MSIRYLLTAVLLAGGCVGDLTPVDDGDDDDVQPDAGGNNNGGGQARQIYERDVFPIMAAKCGADVADIKREVAEIKRDLQSPVANAEALSAELPPPRPRGSKVASVPAGRGRL